MDLFKNRFSISLNKNKQTMLPNINPVENAIGFEYSYKFKFVKNTSSRRGIALITKRPNFNFGVLLKNIKKRLTNAPK